METGKKVWVDYGTIRLNDKKLNLWVFNREVRIERGRFNIQSTLSDGRLVVGTLAPRRWYDPIIALVRLGMVRLDVEITEPFQFRQSLDASTKEKIKEELLTMRCATCREPTRYSISFITFRGPFGMEGGHVKLACLTHLNKTIEAEGKDWIVYEYTNPCQFSKGKLLGRVKYNTAIGFFYPVYVAPEVEPAKVTASSMKVNNRLIYSFNQEDGVLKIGDSRTYQEIMKHIEYIPPEGITVSIHPPTSTEPIELAGVKSVQLVEE